jgi:octaheme c-type cytochrome (tetrathionate reductase family)
MKELQRPFASGPEVTAACLACHNRAGEQLQATIHWTWTFDHPHTGQILGKRHVINSFCGNIVSNLPRCTSCHAGYGWEDETFDFTDQTRVDCLVCHDQTGTYQKFPTDAGHPPYEAKAFEGKPFTPPDLTQVAQSVGLPGRSNCGACHFYGGGGDGVKHGDLDSSLKAPSRALDVHMDANGLDFSCRKCHVEGGHHFAGSRYAVTARDREGIGRPGERRHAATCESCHGLKPHAEPAISHFLLNEHVDRVACQTCHIPAFARGGVPTLTLWDWSQAGRLSTDGQPIHTYDDRGRKVYSSEKGVFEWAENVVPTYFWFDGQVTYTLPGDPVDPSETVSINDIQGSFNDPQSRIWPFKVMRGRQAYDRARNSLVYTHVFGTDEGAYWTHFKWPESIAAAMAAAKQPYSGDFGFVDTVMYWPITHMVAPKEDAVRCDECHTRGGRLAHLTGFYLRGRDRSQILDALGTGGLIVGAVAIAADAARRRWRRRDGRTP